IIAGIAAPLVLNRLEEAKVDRARIDCAAIAGACGQYYVAHGSYPETLDVLIQPQDGGKAYLTEGQLMDPWNQRYQYRNPGTHRDNSAAGRPDVFTIPPGGQQEAGNWPKGQQ